MKSIVITGSSTGIGRSAALALAKRYRVYAGVRGEKVAEELRKLGGENLKPIQLDVTDAETIRKSFEMVRKECGKDGLFALINNAGIAVAGPLEGIPPTEFRKQFEVNVIGLMAVTQAFLPLLREAKGRIVNVGSIAGRLTYPFIGAYSASKFAVEALSDALRRELAPQGLKVSLIEPGAVKTPIWDKSIARASHLRSGLTQEVEALYQSRMDHFENIVKKMGRMAVAPERVVTAITHALESSRPKTRYLVGTEAKVVALLAKVVPDKAFDHMIRKRI